MSEKSTGTASGISVENQNIPPGQEACVAAAATTSFKAYGTAKAPGLKFKVIAQDGTVIISSPAPVTSFSAYIYAGGPDWEGPGDYTVCAKNNGSQTVFLNDVTATGD
jgi:hypothetical protein